MLFRSSTVYLYYGLDDEYAPGDTTKVNFHPSVTTIKNMAFNGCKSLLRITIPDTVTEIEEGAFSDCDSLKSIQLPPNLEFIGRQAFYLCKSLRAIYLPSTVTRIDDLAFDGCTSLRFFCMPEAIDHIGNKVVLGCDQLLTTVQYAYDEDDIEPINNDEVNQWLMQRHANLYLHQSCFSTLVNRHQIEVCIQRHGIEWATEVDDQQMTALHILCANPHVTGGAIRAYLQLAPEAAANA